MWKGDAGRGTRDALRITHRASLLIIFFLITVSSAHAFSFAVIGDTHGNRDGVFSRFLEKLDKDKSLAFVVHVGDLVNYGSDKEYQTYIATIKKHNLRFYQVQGNHDAYQDGWKRFQKYFGPSYYSFDYENSHFIILDNAYRAHFTKAQYNWLASDLKNTRQENIFVFFHRPTIDSTGFYESEIQNNKWAAQKMMNLFNRYRVKYVFCGHIHGFGKAEREGVTYVITGGGGGRLHLPYFGGGFFNYVKISVDRDNIKDEVYKLDD